MVEDKGPSGNLCLADKLLTTVTNGLQRDAKPP